MINCPYCDEGVSLTSETYEGSAVFSCQDCSVKFVVDEAAEIVVVS